MEIVTRRQAAEKIKDNGVFVIGGFCGFVSPDETLLGIRERFEETGHPCGMTMLKGVSVGDYGERGASRVAVPGLVKKVICSHLGLEPATMKLVADGDADLVMLPLGTIVEFENAAASGRKDIITEVGIGTFVDPDVDPDAMADKITVNGTEYLHYETMPVDAALIRMTTADESGNLTCEKEAIVADQFEAAAAAYNSGGIVIAQVERIVEAGTLDPRDVKIHGSMVDYVVVSSPENHLQGFDKDEFRPELVGDIRLEAQDIQPMPFSARKVCGRRAYREMKEGDIVNLGIGMPDAVAAVAGEEGTQDLITLSIESGTLGGVPISGLGLGASINPDAFYKMADILRLYDGGLLDMSVLGLAQADKAGNVNVSKFGGKSVGPGGFIDISQNAKKVVFIGTLTTKNGGKKFVPEVEQITFSAKTALARGQEVLYVTEKAVFRLTEDGPELFEIAPGLDPGRDIFPDMGFVPKVAGDLKEMEAWLFSE
ncbi:MAG: 3-oxoacid CoA-transferase [Clostridia bacterium]|nr:3-oxoacid CoA-transferase [Clostridia bacterium]